MSATDAGGGGGSADSDAAAPPDVDTAAYIASSTEAIDKPDLDERKYRHLRLHNKLQIMLVSDAACGARRRGHQGPNEPPSSAPHARNLSLVPSAH